jgi:hypothetical protein
MLRITVHDGPDHVSVNLEGSLTGTRVAELDDRLINPHEGRSA